ncbi:MAG: L,D-transpeptidase family protein [Thermodesulfobacteriota bacterium]|nr:L,D-transpeptidase family protein [Thermodesulfobacteriota bacterium]
MAIGSRAVLIWNMVVGILLVLMVDILMAQPQVVPDVIVSPCEAGDTRYVIVVEKATQQLSVFECGNGSVRMVNQWPCSTGEVPGTKLESGDKKTPEGVYFLVKKYEDRDLTPIYGIMAFPLDYPNFLDKKAGKNGSAIWLHGTNKELKKNDTNGCVALENGDLEALSAYISLNRTPIIIVEKMGQWPVTVAEKAEQRVDGFITGWRNALTGGDYHRYLDFYDPDYLPDMSWWREWRRMCENISDSGLPFEVTARDISVYRHDDIYVALFDQVLTAGSHQAEVGKKKLFIADSGDNLSIVGETYYPLADYQRVKQKERLLVAASRRLQANALAERRIKALLSRWTQAWESMDMDAYGACYSDGFSFNGMNRRKWLAYKRHLNKQYDFIRVEISNLQFVGQSGPQRVVKFIQHYTSDQYSDTGMKTLVLRQEDGQWTIYREFWEKLEPSPEEQTVGQAEKSTGVCFLSMNTVRSSG